MKKKIGLLTLAAPFIFILGAYGFKGTADKVKIG